MRTGLRAGVGATLVAAVLAAIDCSGGAVAASPVFRVDRVIDGDTIVLRNGQHVRLVQIDAPEVYSGVECYARAASATTKRLLPAGTRVRLLRESASDPVDSYGRLLRYVVRVSDSVNVNLRLVALGAAAPWFSDGDVGTYASALSSLATQAREKRLGLWGACPRTPYDPFSAITTRR